MGGFVNRQSNEGNEVILEGPEYIRKSLKCKASYNPIQFDGVLDGIMEEYPNTALLILIIVIWVMGMKVISQVLGISL